MTKNSYTPLPQGVRKKPLTVCNTSTVLKLALFSLMTDPFRMPEYWQRTRNVKESADDKQQNPEAIPDIYRLCNSLDKIAIALESVAGAIRRLGP